MLYCLQQQIDDLRFQQERCLKEGRINDNQGV
jgi:hypothetical protein